MAWYCVGTWAKYNYAEETSTFELERDNLEDAVDLVQKYLDKRFADETKITHAYEKMVLPEPRPDSEH